MKIFSHRIQQTVKTAFVACLLLSLLFVSGCTLRKSGIDSFSEQLSLTSTTQYLLPDEEFLEKFAYKNSVFEFYEDISLVSIEKVLMVLEYDQETYLSAKQYCLDHMKLLNGSEISVNDYIFSINQKYAEEAFDKSGSFPHDFLMFSYNDNLNRLVFLGFGISPEDADIAEQIETDFGGFLEEHFAEYYDFSA